MISEFEQKILDDLRDRVDYLIKNKIYNTHDLTSLIGKLVYQNNLCYECRIQIWDLQDIYLNLCKANSLEGEE